MNTLSGENTNGAGGKREPKEWFERKAHSDTTHPMTGFGIHLSWPPDTIACIQQQVYF